MNRYGYQQKNAMGGGYEGMRVEHVLCPKPRRFGLLNHSIDDPVPVRPLRRPFNHPSEALDSTAGTELLDIILTEGDIGGERFAAVPMASSPPFFCGSPPCRVSNPVIQDAQFGTEQWMPASPTPSSPSARKGGGGSSGCVRMKFGHKPAAVRIEGFDCLGRGDRRSISVLA